MTTVDLPAATFTCAERGGEIYVSTSQLRAYLYEQADRMDSLHFGTTADTLRLVARWLGTVE